MAFLEASSFTVILPGVFTPAPPPGIDGEDIKNNENENHDSGNRDACDPCKFAILISGGVDSANNHSKYWENLVALYKFKVDSLGYCDSNVFVHYFKGDRRDARIPSANVISADSAKIDSTHQLVAKRVANCTRNGTSATFQKMVTNHGDPSGINLLGNEILGGDHLRDVQQPIIDSCCSTVYDEFLQCYGGNVVDDVVSLDEKSKATIYVNSNADNTTGVSPHGEVHPYLQEKINTLDTGGSYDRAVMNAKLAYDNYVQGLINEAIAELNAWIASPPETPNRAVQIGLWADWIAELGAKICKSRNVTIVPFTHWCQWKKFVVPPGGQLVVDFSGSDDDCGNATVYKENAAGEKVRVKVWNWNHPGSRRYEPGNERRVINAEMTGPTTFWIHNDNDTSRLVVQVLGSQVFPESVSNGPMYPGFSCGGTDLSSIEFGNITAPNWVVPQIEIVELSLASMVPACLGIGGVQNFQFGFQINPTDIFWSNMSLYLHVLEVDNPGSLLIQNQFGSGPPIFSVPIPGPGIFEIPLGDFTLGGWTYGHVVLSPDPSLQMCFDSFGMRSGVPSTAHTTVWLGELSTDWNDPLNWSDGIPGPNSSVIISPDGFAPIITTDVMIKNVEIMEGATINTAPGATVILTNY